MGLLVRVLLAVGGVGAAFLVGQDADNFGVVQGMLALLVVEGGIAGHGNRAPEARLRPGEPST
jgi:hypothetical protein